MSLLLKISSKILFHIYTTKRKTFDCFVFNTDIIVKPNTFCENRRIWANFFHAVSKYFPRGDNIMIKRRHAYPLFSLDKNL